MTICDREAALLDTLESGEIDAGWDRHLEECASCREVRLVWAALRADSPGEPGVVTAAIPAPGLIWWRAQLAARRAAVARAERPLRAMHWAAGLLTAASIPWLAGWMFGGQAAAAAVAATVAFLAIPAGGLLYYWKRG